MNINLIYQNNSFNFDLRKDISINYLEDLASKLIKKDKSSFELLYKDNNLSENKNSFLKDIVKIEPNIPINILIKLKSVTKFSKLKLLKNINNSDNSNEVSNNLNLNETEISQSMTENSVKVFQNLSKNKFSKKKIEEYTTQNKVFEEICNSKDNEIISLMKTLSQKIKEYDDILYKNCKKSFNKNNNKLITFEKNIMNFKDKQIQFIKKLINFFEAKEQNDSSMQNIDLDEFYKELNLYDNKDISIVQNINRIKNLEKNLSPIKSKNYTNNNKELPLIHNNNIRIVNKLNLSEKKADKTININNNDKEEKKEKFLYNSEKRIIRKMPINDNNILSNKLYNNINIKEGNQFNSLDSNKNINNKIYLQRNSLDNTTKANTNISDNSNSSKAQEKITNKSHLILPIKLSNKSKKNTNINNNKNSNTDENNIDKNKNDSTRNKNYSDLFKRVNTIQNINYNRKRVSHLFEISESLIRESKESESDRYNDNSSEKESSDNDDSNEIRHKNKKVFNDNEDIKKLKMNLNKKKNTSINYSQIKNSKIGYLIKARNRKVNQRIKKLGNNPNDFLI